MLVSSDEACKVQAKLQVRQNISQASGLKSYQRHQNGVKDRRHLTKIKGNAKEQRVHGYATKPWAKTNTIIHHKYHKLQKGSTSLIHG